jgi:hypothetical protein
MLRSLAARGALALTLVLSGGAGLPDELARDAADLPPAPPFAFGSAPPDWLIQTPEPRAGVYRGADAQEIVLDNGLIRRVFRLAPALATIALDSHVTGASLVRAVEPEARVTLDGREHRIGGLLGQPERAYLRREFLQEMTPDPGAFACHTFEVGAPAPTLEWTRVRHAENRPWPPPGVALTFRCASPDATLAGVQIGVHYELYDGLPLYAKWLTVTNGTDREIVVDSFEGERLAFVEAESDVEKRGTGEWRRPPLEVFSDYAFGGGGVRSANRTTEFLPDPSYTSQVNYRLEMPALVVSRPPVGPAWPVGPGETFTSFRTHVLVYDSTDRERRGLSARRAFRTLAPWSTENPLMMHVRRADSETFRAAVDQCVETGFEMIIYTFGSGIDMETDDAAEIERLRADVAYAHERGIEVGAYSLFSSRTISPEDDVINPRTGRPGGTIFNNAPCLGSRWGARYLEKVRGFIETVGLDLLEHDGPYPGDVCASTSHPGHRGEGDSQWAQWKLSVELYAWARSRGVYLNIPDFYFLTGSNKVAMGYREVNWSLPRAQQIILGRQNIYDGTWTKTPSMGWMFVPLTEYHGGGAAATLEPLREHLDAYEGHLTNNLAAGVQACYRGPRLYDSPETKALVKTWVSWFKEHRPILESDVIHLRRADGRDVDGLLHVNPTLRERGMAVLWNPLSEPVGRELTLPLYYTGLVGRARVRGPDGTPRVVTLGPDRSARVTVRLEADGFTWLVFEEAP